MHQEQRKFLNTGNLLLIQRHQPKDMNFLIIHSSNIVHNASSGIIRVSALLGKIFGKHNHRCFNAYYKDTNGEPAFEHSVKLTPATETEQLRKALIDWDIDVVISQIYPTADTVRMLSSLRKSMEGIKRPLIVECCHNCPYIEIRGYDMHYLRFLLASPYLKTAQRIKKMAWGMACMLLPRTMNRMVAKRYQKVIDLTDKFVLLSDKFMPRVREYQNLKKGQLQFANNPETYTESLAPDDLEKKEKCILIVARLEENQKRLSYCFEMWKELQKDSRFSDWCLDVVGEGYDAGYYHQMAKKLKLQRVTFYGNQNPTDWYRKSQIMLMTSAYEGWGMTLIEAQSMGVVPIVFDSYESLSDVVTDGINGCTVPNRDKKAFLNQLRQLMLNDKLRKDIQLNCLKSSGRFSEDIIYQQWMRIIGSK